MASLEAIVSLTWLGGEDGHLIRALLDHGLDQALIQVLQLAERPDFICKALAAIANVLADTPELGLHLATHCELIECVLHRLNCSMDASEHLNALRVVNSIVLADWADEPLLLALDKAHPTMLTGLTKRGLKSCSQNQEMLVESLQSLQRLLMADQGDQSLPLESEARILARFLAAEGEETLLEV